MKTTKEEILLASLRLFAAKGFDAVSTSMIASELGITKGALYNHFENKQQIFDSILQRMFELDEIQAEKNAVPVKEYSDDEESYVKTDFGDLCKFVNEQFIFWTENKFACLFRRMVTLEQFRSAEMNKLYQDVIALGPVRYTEELFRVMMANGQLKDEARTLGERGLALEIFAPLQLSIQLYDGGEDSDRLKDDLRTITNDFQTRWIK